MFLLPVICIGLNPIAGFRLSRARAVISSAAYSSAWITLKISLNREALCLRPYAEFRFQFGMISDSHEISSPIEFTVSSPALLPRFDHSCFWTASFSTVAERQVSVYRES